MIRTRSVSLRGTVTRWAANPGHKQPCWFGYLYTLERCTIYHEKHTKMNENWRYTIISIESNKCLDLLKWFIVVHHAFRLEIGIGDNLKKKTPHHIVDYRYDMHNGIVAIFTATLITWYCIRLQRDFREEEVINSNKITNDSK